MLENYSNDFKRRKKVNHLPPEIVRIYREFPDEPWSDFNLKADPNKDNIWKQDNREQKGICLTLALTEDGFVYERVTRIQSGPTSAVLESSKKKWSLNSREYTKEPEQWLNKKLSEGWEIVQKHKIGINKDPYRTISSPETDSKRLSGFVEEYVKNKKIEKNPFKKALSEKKTQRQIEEDDIFDKLLKESTRTK